jgi:hypothetical protein
MKRYPQIGLEIPQILLPKKDIDLQKWAVIACDQHTSQPEYWREVKKIVGQAPSTLHMIFPEVFLDEADGETRIESIHQHMRTYLEKQLFTPHEGLILVERTVDGRSRFGMMAALDLDCYDFTANAKSLIRATEGTILERIPPRVKIRQDAILEIPHIMVLIDDPENSVLSPLSDNRHSMEKVYDIDLMLGSGHLTGWINHDQIIETRVVQALEKLADKDHFMEQYQTDLSSGILLYAMGDGNHSLATAKSIWEKIKKLVPSDHLARYALVEIENIHDTGLVFEPIHRALFGIKQNFKPKLAEYFDQNFQIQPVSSWDQMRFLVQQRSQGTQSIGLITSDGYEVLTIKKPKSNLAVGSLQPFLDEYLFQSGAEKIDYVHGDEAVLQIGKQPGNLVFYLPKIKKTDLFKTVLTDGALPKKTFSMGEAKEKRFYLECRQIG